MREYFYGWYLKCQGKNHTLAVIPAIHESREKKSCSIQLILNGEAWNVEFPVSAWKMNRGNPALGYQGRRIEIAGNRFGNDGIILDIEAEAECLNTGVRKKLKVKGKLRFGTLHPLRYDIMGPFLLVPGMECRHLVVSMYHTVTGVVWVNGKRYRFLDAAGYWEGDCGHSFPKKYIWTQCSFGKNAFMLSVAEIPFGRLRFQGVIGVILWKGKEYRVATYLGAVAKMPDEGIVRVRRGCMELEVRIQKPQNAENAVGEMNADSGCTLKAPMQGSMSRTVKENISGTAYVRFCRKGRTVFAFETDKAAFEQCF